MQDIHKAAEVLSTLGPAVLLSSDGIGVVHVGRAQHASPQGPAGPYWFLADARRVASWQPSGQLIALTYHAPGSPLYMTLHGTAEALDDQIARAAAWDSRFAAWFPQGPSDPRLALLQVHLTAAQCVEWTTPLAG